MWMGAGDKLSNMIATVYSYNNNEINYALNHSFKNKPDGCKTATITNTNKQKIKYN